MEQWGPGSLVKSEFFKPSQEGVRIYFNARCGDVAVEAGRAAAAKGEVMHARTLTSEEIGYYAVIRDTEENLIALHARK